MKLQVFAFATSLLTVVACDDHDHDHHHPDANVADAAPLTVSVAFAARVGGTAFACGQTYTGIGTTAASYVASDFRFYVHDVRLVGTNGDVPLVLDTDDFQADGIALLDFENAGTGCQMGSTATHTSLTGTVPPDTYTGIKFKVGLPFDKNHLDAATATAPLNVTAMYWAWSSGYKFLKADGAVGGNGFNLHLGSTGCNSSGTTPPTAPCTNPNVLDISLAGYTLGTSVIVADVANVLSGVDVTTNTASTAPGCMSFPGDPECDTIFPKLGLSYAANPAGAQALFAVE